MATQFVFVGRCEWDQDYPSHSTEDVRSVIHREPWIAGKMMITNDNNGCDPEILASGEGARSATALTHRDTEQRTTTVNSTNDINPPTRSGETQAGCTSGCLEVV